MARRRFLSVLVAALLIAVQALDVAAATGFRAPAAGAPAAPIAAGLIDELRSGERMAFVVEFSATTDLRGAGRFKDKADKGRFVLDALTTTMNVSQGEAVRLLRGVKGVKADGHWLTNVLIVRADLARGQRPDRVTAARLADLAERMARLRGVSLVRSESVYRLIEPVKSDARPAAEPGGLAPEWGIEKVRAPEAWEIGITGSGAVVATIDTGVEYTHEALVEHYRGNEGGGTFVHDYNWWDPTGICGAEPCDNAGHGTHTMGTIVGGDLDGPLPDIGVAPGAEWIAAKGCEDFGCSEGSLLSAGEFMVAPWDSAGENPDPAKAPDLVSNSWGSDNPEDTFYLETVQAWRAAGIIPVFAAGNAGPFCGSAGTPGNYVEVISAGATDIDDIIAEFSSRGPSPTDKISPNLSAPGVDVISSIPGGGYGSGSGTSMATPHVAGAIALMISAKTALAGDFDAILHALNVTAVDRPDDQCGSPDEDLDPNFVYGEGRLDAMAAVNLVKSGGTLVGSITDGETDLPIAGAKVSADDGERTFSTRTDADGTYDLFLAAGTYAVSAGAFGYETAATFGVEIQTDVETTVNLALAPLPRFTVSGVVSSAQGGAPVEGASVVAVGTPVAPAMTDAAGAYAIELPIGDYTLRASQSGCTDAAFADISSAGDDVVQDFRLTRKVDAFGHACRPIPFAWVDAEAQTALYGDDTAGRLRLPFEFPFYEASYRNLFVSTNGFVNFLGPDSPFIPVGIPSADFPNAAIYALWFDLVVVDDDSSIDHATVGSGDDAAFVVEYDNVRVLGSQTRLSFEVKLWADGTIDLLYGPNPANPGDGRRAAIGIEDDAGGDGLQIGFFERIIEPNSAIRIETLPIGIATGIVSDANDGLPIRGATITAEPGGRLATTDGDGRYELRLLPGDYELTASAGTYEPASASIGVLEGETTSQDFSLTAATASASPTSIVAEVEFGATTTADVRLSNDGGAILAWEAKERELGVVGPDLPPAIAGVFRSPTWSRIPLPAMALAPVRPFDVADLPVIIDDPDDDSLGSTELFAVRGLSDAEQMNLGLDFGPTTPMDGLGGYILFDVDQDPTTGLPPEVLYGLPTQDIGFEYWAHIFDIPFTGTVPVFDLEGNLVAQVPATVDGDRVSFGVPLAAFGGDDGAIDVTMVVGQFGPEDWAPDVGHGTVQTFSDAPWMFATPASGTIGAGGYEDVVVTLGGTDVGPGVYTGQLVFVTNAPRNAQVPVDVTLTVTTPEAFGRAGGTVSDAHSGAPIADATVVVHATWAAAPLDLVATSAADGTWSIVGPEGTWPTDVFADGYVGGSISTTIVRGVTTGGADASLHLVQPHAAVDGGPFTFILTEGRTGHGTIVVSNPDGHANLTFTVAELDRGGIVAPTGHGTWLTSPNATAVGGANARTATEARPSAYRWLATPAAEASILVYADDAIHTAPNTFVDQALQRLGRSYVAHYDGDWSGFLDDLESGTWSLVLVANDNFRPESAVFDALDAYVGGGGRLAFHGWTVGDDPSHPLWAALGVGFVDNDLDPPDPVYWWEPGHPAFTIPELVPEPTSLDGFIYGIYGQKVLALDGAQAIAGYTTPEQEAKEAALVVGPTGTTVFKGFLDGQNSADLDTDGTPDGVELWVNLVVGLETGFVSDAPWLTISPADGSVAPDEAARLDVVVDARGLASGVYSADILVRTNDPAARLTMIPVTLVVPRYQQGINAGGETYTDADGDRWAADLAFVTGSFGWVGPSSVRRTGAPIDATDDDPLFQTLRLGMTAYRFTVPNGVYQVDLAFAELQARHAGDRVFDVRFEEELRLASFDVFATAAGERIALMRSLLVTVTDGVLDIAFTAQRGDMPIVNAIMVTELPEGAPGR